MHPTSLLSVHRPARAVLVLTGSGQATVDAGHM